MKIRGQKIRDMRGSAALAFCALILTACGEKSAEYHEVKEIKSPVKVVEPVEQPRMESIVGFHFQLPEDWKQVETGKMQVLSLQAGTAPAQVADVSVSRFPGDVGGQLANINRWRRQVGLGPVSEEAVAGFVETITISGQTGWRVDFVGPTVGGNLQPRLIVSVLSRGGETWFFKITGSDLAVGDELAAYETFIKSIHFEQ